MKLNLNIDIMVLEWVPLQNMSVDHVTFLDVYHIHVAKLLNKWCINHSNERMLVLRN